MENTLSLKSYYQLCYVSVWLTGILLTIVNISMKCWNIDFHLTLDWSNAAWPIGWLKLSLKLCKLNGSVVPITNTSCVYLLIYVRVYVFRLIHTYCKIQESFLLIYKQELKREKVTCFFPNQLTCERRSLFQDMTWSCLSINPGL